MNRTERIDEIAEMFPQLMRSLFSMKGDRMHLRDLTVGQMRCLFALRRIGPCSLKDLSAHLQIGASAASTVVDGLVSKGMVQRQRDEQDRRRIILALDDAGRKLVNRCWQHRRRRLRRFLDDLSDADLTAMHQALLTLNGVVGRRQDGKGD